MISSFVNIVSFPSLCRRSSCRPLCTVDLLPEEIALLPPRFILRRTVGWWDKGRVKFRLPIKTPVAGDCHKVREVVRKIARSCDRPRLGKPRRSCVAWPMKVGNKLAHAKLSLSLKAHECSRPFATLISICSYYRAVGKCRKRRKGMDRTSKGGIRPRSFLGDYVLYLCSWETD